MLSAVGGWCFTYHLLCFACPIFILPRAILANIVATSYFFIVPTAERPLPDYAADRRDGQRHLGLPHLRPDHRARAVYHQVSLRWSDVMGLFYCPVY